MNNEDLFKKLNSDDALNRCDAIEELSKDIELEEVAAKIREHFYDKVFLVRCEAYDAFYRYDDAEIMEELCRRLKRERSQCARMHLCSTICSIIRKSGCKEQLYKMIKECYAKEKAANVLLSYWCIFYLTEQDKRYIKMILSHINDEDYHIRCNVINLLADIEDDFVKQYERDAYTLRLEKENSGAVKSLLRDALNNL